MSWWETGPERLSIGDSPADAVTDGLKRLAAEKSQAKPTLAQLLGSLRVALQQEDTTLRDVTAETDKGEITAGNEQDKNLEFRLVEIIQAVKKEYQEDLERAPTTKEILACFLFVLGFQPERYLSSVDGITVEGIEGKFAG